MYRISCRECDAMYIGETGRSLHKRLRAPCRLGGSEDFGIGTTLSQKKGPGGDMDKHHSPDF